VKVGAEDGEGEPLGLTDGLGEGLTLGLAEGLAEGEIETLGLTLGLTLGDADGLAEPAPPASFGCTMIGSAPHDTGGPSACAGSVVLLAKCRPLPLWSR